MDDERQYLYHQIKALERLKDIRKLSIAELHDLALLKNRSKQLTGDDQ